jgi:hypothetical protein
MNESFSSGVWRASCYLCYQSIGSNPMRVAGFGEPQLSRSITWDNGNPPGGEME